MKQNITAFRDVYAITHHDKCFKMETATGNYIFKLCPAPCKEVIITGILMRQIPNNMAVVNLYENAILMEDLGSPMQKAEVIADFEHVMDILSEVQKCSVPINYAVDCIELKWLENLANEMDREELTEMLAKLTDYYQQLDVLHFDSAFPLCFTHGDLHCGNLFDRQGIKFIDFEHAAMSSPLRDITMLVQDVADVENVIALKDKVLTRFNEPHEFDVFLLINSVKMMVWQTAQLQRNDISRAMWKSEMDRRMALLAKVLN